MLRLASKLYVQLWYTRGREGTLMGLCSGICSTFETILPLQDLSRLQNGCEISLSSALKKKKKKKKGGLRFGTIKNIAHLREKCMYIYILLLLLFFFRFIARSCTPRWFCFGIWRSEGWWGMMRDDEGFEIEGLILFSIIFFRIKINLGSILTKDDLNFWINKWTTRSSIFNLIIAVYTEWSDIYM